MAQLQSRREFLVTGGMTLAGVMVKPAFAVEGPHYDFLFKNAQVLDGSGRPARKADIAVKGDTIAAIDAIPSEQARNAIDVAGLHISPGFIDIHSHSDLTILSHPTADNCVFQGITTEVTGNCGYSAAPVSKKAADREILEKRFGFVPQWDTVSSYFDAVEKLKISVNHAFLIGHGTLRSNIIGSIDRKMTPAELKTTARAVEEGMDQGAFGLSTGLEYAPGIYAPIEEIVELARLVSRRKGLYASHIRNEVDGVLAAIEEAIHIGREAGVRVQVSHLKAIGRPNWWRQKAALDIIEKARAGGVDVMADAYPYTAYATSLTLFLEPWAREGGSDDIKARLKNPKKRERIRSEAHRRVQNDPGGYDLAMILNVDSEIHQTVVGKNLIEIAEMWQVEPVDALLKLLEETGGIGGFIGHGMSPENVEMVLSHPLVMIGSDGASMPLPEAGSPCQAHPRCFGTYPKVLGHYTRERKIMDLPTAVKKMTTMPAARLGLRDRGRIARGMKADLVVFDAATVLDKATFENPCQYSVGIKYVMVNGQLVVENEKHTGRKPGGMLRRV
ncbi:MAG: D-aminoacylase [Deltaproteobacteria bacterium]|nr:D-aminoacylase [Deltaproteobacteria bacterium]